MIDRGHDLPVVQQAKALGISRGSIYYLSRPVPAADLAVMRRMDELHLELPFAGSRMLRDLLNKEGIADRALPCRDADEASAHRGALPQAKHLETDAWAQDLPVSAAWPDDRSAQSGLGHRHHLRAHGARVRLPRRHHRLVQSPGPVLAAIDHHGGRCLASRFWRKHSPGTASRRSSTATRVRSSRATPSPACCGRRGSPSAWTAEARGATTSSSNGCGGRSNTRRSICTPTTASARRAPLVRPH
uniref:Transposase n=1 Tax=Pseudomonas sp. K-62 TaxID=76885 RepID=I2FG00_9PSED|nr:transposase [Pseudomonas sp. K-62]